VKRAWAFGILAAVLAGAGGFMAGNVAGETHGEMLCELDRLALRSECGNAIRFLGDRIQACTDMAVTNAADAHRWRVIARDAIDAGRACGERRR
jgi:hypothetical protein